MERNLVRAAFLVLAALGPASLFAQQVKPDADSMFNAGLAHLKEGRPSVALEEFKKAIKVDDKNSLYYKGLTVAYAQLADRCLASDNGCREGRLKESIDAARKGLELNPLYVDMHNDLGTALLKLGKREEGKRELLLAFNDATNPYPEVSARNLGQASFEEQNYAEAINWFRTSVGRNKSYPDAYLGLADSLLVTGRPDEALLTLEAGVKELPLHPALLVALGEAYQRAGRLNDARTKLEEASRRDPGGPAGKRALELIKGLPSRQRLPYQSILERLVRATDGAIGALMLDGTGEVVAEAGASDERHRLIGIYQGIMLATARRALGRLPVGDIHCVLTRYEARTLILRPLRDGYYVVVTLGPGADVPRGIRRSAAAQDRMNEAM